jgi:UDP-N-acetylglucosamine 3-dehydrogenase
MSSDTTKVRTPLRGAIVGFGNVAIHAHLPIWQKSELFTIEAIVEPSPEQAEMGRKLLPTARLYPNIEALLSENWLDFVDICAPPCFHAEYVLAACRSGLHVFCEKPLAICTERLREIHQLAEQKQRVIFTVNNWKYAPLWLKAAELIRDDQIGTVQSIALTVLRSPNSGGGTSDWRKCIEIAQGGILIDHGWHNLYLILSIVQDFPVSMTVRMESSSTGGSNVEETVDLVMQFRKAEASLHLSWHGACRRNYGTIVGDKGRLLVKDDHLVLHSRDLPPARFHFPEALSAGSHHPEWMEPVVEDFAREIMETRYRGANLTEARWCAHLINLAYCSSRDASVISEVCCPAPDVST